jgi:nuclear GTP-binding protein
MAQSRRAYVKELKKVVQEADVIIEVLDARDPEGCRNKDLEQQALKQDKKILLVMNKIDLIPPQNAKVWQKYLRREFPTVLFKCNTQN